VSIRTLGLLGIAACAAALLLWVVDARAALAGWLAAFTFWGAVPLGALALRLMTGIIPGAWRTEVTPTSEMLLVLLPLVALAVLPVLIGIRALYPWSAAPMGEGFRGVYLTAWFFSLRSVLFLAGTIVLGFLLMTRPAWSLALASVGLIAFVLVDTTVAVDWLMSLDPDFDSSGFGLYVLSIQMMIALIVIVIIRLVAAPEQVRPELLAALMLTALLLWEYFAFMQYFIIWSENLPKRVAWFRDRGQGLWAAAEYAFSALTLVPTFLLFFGAIRRSRSCLLTIATAVLLARAIEIAWLVFPAVKAPPLVQWIAAFPALLGLACLSGAALAWIGRAPVLVRRVPR